MLASGEIERAGVWLESQDLAERDARGLATFRGVVAGLEEVVSPGEWSRLSPEAPLPAELLEGQSIEQELDDMHPQPVLGALVGMRRAVWVPVGNEHHLRGVLLAGTAMRSAALPRALLESMAAELLLALQLEDERNVARERQGELFIARQALASLGNSDPAETILTNLLESCTQDPSAQQGAVFAVIGELQEDTLGNTFERSPEESGGSNGDNGGHNGELALPPQRGSSPKPLLAVSWRSGNAAWMGAVESEPLAAIWRRAVETRRAIESEPGVSWSRGEVSRVLAIPLEASGAILGILMAGFQHVSAAPAMVRRLEVPAGIATLALLDRRRERKRKRQAAWQSALLNASGEALVLVDQRGEIAGLSLRAQDVVSKTPIQDISDKQGPRTGNFLDMFGAQERQRMETWLEHVLRDEPARTDEHAREAELSNGARVRVRRVTTESQAGSVVVLDPVPAAAAAPQRDEDQARLLGLIEWLEEGVVLFDANNDIRAMNSRFAQMVSLPAEGIDRINTLDALIGHVARQTAEPRTFAGRWRALGNSAQSAVREEIQLRHPAPRVLERAARPIEDASGRRLGHVEIYRDLTAQRLLHSKLLQTEKLAALGQMVTGIAHELSSPLTSILGYAQRLLLRRDAAGNPEEAAQILQEAERASTILRQLLVTARESGPGRGKVALNEVVSRALELQKFSLAAEKIHVELVLDPHLPFVHGDAGQLQQVLMNLVGNARQAIEQQGRGGFIRLSTKQTAGRRVILEVADDGAGIPESIRARIFDPFFTTKPAGIGTGLGLSIVLGIVREHGGQVRVASPPGGGATFTLEFPAATEETRPTGLPAAGPGLQPERLPLREMYPAAPAGTLRTSSRASAPKGRVLVVEDEPTVARLIGDVLEDDGFRVDLLFDSPEALKRVAKENYDLVICDMKMPRLDGQRFYNTLTRTGNPLREKFLFVTGDVIAAQTHEFLERNRLPHLTKPFRIEELIEKVNLVLAAGQGLPVSSEVPRSGAARK